MSGRSKVYGTSDSVLILFLGSSAHLEDIVNVHDLHEGAEMEEH